MPLRKRLFVLGKLLVRLSKDSMASGIFQGSDVTCLLIKSKLSPLRNTRMHLRIYADVFGLLSWE